MGGYSWLPALLYVILFRKKIFFCEQNRVVGKVTRIFQKYANKNRVFSFPPVNIEDYNSISYKIPAILYAKKLYLIQNKHR